MSPDFKTVTFLSVFYCTVVYCSESAAEEVPIIVNERATFYREIDSKFFSAFPYYSARFLAQQPLLLAQGFIIATPLFWLAIGNFPAFGMDHKANVTPEAVEPAQRFADFLVFFAICYLALSVSATFSQAWASASPNEGVGNVLYFTMCCLSRLFSGFIIFIKNMGGAATGGPADGDYNVIRIFGRFFNMLEKTYLDKDGRHDAGDAPWAGKGLQSHKTRREENETAVQNGLQGVQAPQACV